MKKQMTDFRVVAREDYLPNFFVLTLQGGEPLGEVRPGQFVEVAVPDCREVMLRRPISVHDVDVEAGTLSLLVQVVGRGTERLSQVAVGSTLNVIWPLGRGFSVAGERVLLVGGGTGVAPLLYLAKCYAARGVRPTLLLGGRTSGLIPTLSRYEPWGRLCVATDDGSLGERGLVTEHSCFAEPYDHICACGPTPMMKAVARSARQRGIDCEVSLENMMACGLGACLCCVAATDEGHKCVCREGPVFDIKHLNQWMNE